MLQPASGMVTRFVGFVLLLPALALAQSGAPDGAALYKQNCASCHDGGMDRAPSRRRCAKPRAQFEATPGWIGWARTWPTRVFQDAAEAGLTVEQVPRACARLSIHHTPAVYWGRIYVWAKSGEEAAGASPDYECCRFRGSLVALDASTGKLIWKTYLFRKRRARLRSQLRSPRGWRDARQRAAGIFGGTARRTIAWRRVIL